MSYNSSSREIVIGIRREIEMPKDASFVTQILPGKSSMTIVHSYQTYKTPQERDVLMKTMEDYKKLIYTQDIIAFVPNGTKSLEDNLIHLLIDLRNDFWQKGFTLQVDKITEKLRAMGVVLMDRKDSHLFWNANGEMR